MQMNLGVMQYLCSDASSYLNGHNLIVVEVDLYGRYNALAAHMWFICTHKWHIARCVVDILQRESS